MNVKINLLKKQNYLTMPWKNGRGFTSEIAIFPVGSTLAQNDFTWRLSSAEITENGLFSIFSDCERYLTIIEGHGVHLQFKNDHEVVDQKSFLWFSGNDEVHCKLINGHVKDLNLIVKNQAHQVRFEILDRMIEKSFKGMTIIFVLEGFVKIENICAEKFDTITIEAWQDENLVRILPDINSSYVLITIS